MKKILITGKSSYIGTSLENWLDREPHNYQVETIDMRDEGWRLIDFSTYDVVFHVAGIAHVSTDPKMKELYYKVNRDLTIEVAKKAKQSGVKQFIFMSSIIVYGNKVNQNVITADTLPQPSNFYGDSKLQAERGIELLGSDDFKIAVIRPPMIYGKKSKGNYPRLAKLAQQIPLFPDYPNRRSMLYIDNLSQFIKIIIDNNDAGLYFPQNRQYVKTSDLVCTIARVHNKKIVLTSLFNPVIKLLVKGDFFNKIFGDLVYDQSLSKYENADYQVRTFAESIELTESEYISHESSFS